MKNRELIERLRELPDDAEVRLCGEALDERVSAVEFFRPGNAVRIWADHTES
ncbi:MAG TPA: hypothetical protein VMR31_08730 [Myxococcota bacterium]|jgi:hypothetical protein|nr:hypothetical protein [Myxococcota bacterium]